MVRGRKNPLHFGLGDRLKRARKARGLSYAALARLAGMGSHSGPALIERSLNTPELHTVEKLANALGVGPGWLAYGEPGGGPPSDGPRYAGLPARLREARELAGVTRTALERLAGLAVGSGVRIEAGRNVPSVRTLEQIAIALSVSPAWLAFGEGDQVVVRMARGGSAEQLADGPDGTGF